MSRFRLAELEAAAEVVHETLAPTPALAWPLLAARCGAEVVVKHESHLPIGSFKLRGGLVYARELAAREPGARTLVAALSSCHMLTFLALAARRRLVVERYEDEAVGQLEKNAQGRLAITRATLRPRVAFGGEKTPTADEISRLHHLAHEQCFIANSVTTLVTVEPRTDP